MNEKELEQYDYEEDEGVSRSDKFLAKHYEELFYMTPKELAVAINAMNENELIQFNQTIHKGHGMNVCLMRDKVDALGEYQNLNSIFIKAFYRTSIIDGICSLPDYSDLPYKETFHKIFESFKYFTEDEGNQVNTNAASHEILFYIYPAFRDHFSKLKNTGVIKEVKNGLEWTRNDIAIAEYFNCLECKQQRQKWIIIEKVFNKKNLCQYLRTHKDRQSGKPSKDFEEIKQLLELE